jgi:hypothetical protein
MLKNVFTYSDIHILLGYFLSATPTTYFTFTLKYWKITKHYLGKAVEGEWATVHMYGIIMIKAPSYY